MQTSLEKVTLNNFIETIGDFAFDGCSALNTVTNTGFLRTIGSKAFRNCTALKTFGPISASSIAVDAFVGWGADQTILASSSAYFPGNLESNASIKIETGGTN